MNTIQIAKLIENCTVAISAFDDEDLYSNGSGVIINDRGYVVTADHVITDNKTLSPEEIEKGSVTIKCKVNGKYQSYKPIAWNISIDAEYFKKEIKFDFAVLIPVEPVMNVSYIPISDRKPIIGEDVLLGGFPEDIDPPFNFEQHINLGTVKGYDNIKNLETKLAMFNRFLMIKKAIISKVYNYNANGSGINLTGSTFYFDNVMHAGGSGGPIVSSEGTLLGIISKRAVIELNYEDSPKGIIPSGSGLGITCDTLIQFLKYRRISL